MGLHYGLDIYQTATEWLDMATELTRNIPRAFKRQFSELIVNAALEITVLIEALTPFNDLLFDLSKAADWKRVSVNAEMEITANARSYRLLSESEQWRCDAVLAIAIANLSGIRFVMLDRFDVLQVSDRGSLLALLDHAVDQLLLDSAVVAGTLKAAPNGLSENFHPIWMEDGMAVGQEQKQVA